MEEGFSFPGASVDEIPDWDERELPDDFFLEPAAAAADAEPAAEMDFPGAEFWEYTGHAEPGERAEGEASALTPDPGLPVVFPGANALPAAFPGSSTVNSVFPGGGVMPEAEPESPDETSD